MSQETVNEPQWHIQLKMLSDLNIILSLPEKQCFFKNKLKVHEKDNTLNNEK